MEGLPPSPHGLEQRQLRDAISLHRAGHVQDAAQIYRELLVHHPNHADGLHLLGMVNFQIGNVEEAEQLIRRAIRELPSAAAFHANLGNVLQARHNNAEAEICYRTSLALRPRQAEVWMHLGHLMKRRVEVDAALICYEHALAIDPSLKEAEAAKGTALLLKGEFHRGWELFEARWHLREWKERPKVDGLPRWRGEALEQGRLLIWGEQGVGDQIMFAGLVPELLTSGVRCVLACEPRLQPLFARSFPGAVVIADSELRSLPELQIVAQIPSASLPGILRRSSDWFERGSSPYLAAESGLRASFESRYRDGRMQVGVAWHTRNRVSGASRSMTLDALRPLFNINGVRWVSLQYGDHEALRSEAVTAGAPLVVDNEVDQLKNIDSFAAQVASMDLVITIDNSTAHLAGALGVPTWLLLPHASDWRWLLERSDSPWYPSIEIFRSFKPEDWIAVVEKVRARLTARRKQI